MFQLAVPDRNSRCPAILVLLAFASATTNGHCAAAEDWPQWRGPRRDAVSEETGLLKSWPEGGPRLAWQASGLGTGYVSVAVSGGRVFTMGRQQSDVVVTALLANGQTAVGPTATGPAEIRKPEWTRKIGTTARNPCSTPTVDGELLYALDPDGELVCLKAASGEIVWQKSFVEDFGGRMMSGRGFGESPLIDGDKLICTPGGPDAAIVALDKRSGAVVWKSKLPNLGTAGKEGAGFSSIVVTEAAGIRQYVQLVGRGVIGVAAQDGRFLWGYNAIANGTANIPTPVVRGDLVFAANGYNAGSVLLRLLPDVQAGGTTGVTAREEYVLNGSQFQNHHGGVVLVGEHLYGGHGSNNGLPTCLELQSGNVVWKRRGPGVGSAAVLYADGNLYFRYQNGLVALIEASPSGYSLKGTLQIPGAGGDSWAHPVVANGRLYLREQDALWVYDIHREGATAPAIATASPAGANAVLAELRKAGLAAELLAASTGGTPVTPGPPVAQSTTLRPVETEKAGRLYRYAVAPSNNGTPPSVLVSLTDKHLTPAGTFSEDLLGRLKSANAPMVLSLAGTRVSNSGLQQIQGLPGVVGLNLESCRRITDAGLESLQLLAHLRVLILTGTGVTQAGLRHLTPIKSLTALDLEGCDGITDSACGALGELRSLKALVLKKTGFEPKGISDEGLLPLRNLTELELLNLYGNKLTDAGLMHLASLINLEELNLSLLAITDKGLTQLKTLRNLRQLELLYSEGFAGPMITNAGLESLAQMDKLNVLNLTGARITDASLKQLQGLKHLTRLDLARTPVTAEGIRAFREKVPACAVIK